MKTKGFTLIELVAIVVVLGVIAAIAAPKFVNLKDSAILANMEAMEGSLRSAHNMVQTKIRIAPESLNNAENRYTLENGQVIRVRGKLPDGRWNNTFQFLVDFQDIAQVNSNNCTDPDLKWCVRQRNQNWFNSRGYSSLGTGRGFVIFPFGTNVNQDRCYIYYMNQNANANPDPVQPSIIGSDLSECDEVL